MSATVSKERRREIRILEKQHNETRAKRTVHDAAPAMLDALKMAERFISGSVGPDAVSMSAQEYSDWVLRVVRSAITKATVFERWLALENRVTK